MKFFSLVKNELIKLYSHKSTIVITAIILAITMLWSVIDMEDFENMFSYSDDDNGLPETYCHYKEAQEEYDANIERALAAGVEEGDWRAGYYSRVQSNTNEYYYCMSVIEYLETEGNSVFDGSFMDKFGEYYEEGVTDDQVIEAKRLAAKEYRANIESYWKLIEDNDYSLILNNYYENSKKTIQASLKWAERFREVLVEQKATQEELEVFDNYIKDIELFDQYNTAAYETALEKNLKGSPVIHAEVTALAQAVSGLPNNNGYYYYDEIIGDNFNYNTIYDKKGFSDYLHDCEVYENDPSHETYSEYLESERENFAVSLQKVAVISYAFENDVAEMTTADSTRNNLRGLLTFSLFEFIALFGIFIAGNIVSSEYSRKTINMLVIRPISRRSIFLSKYVACLASVYLTAAAGILVAVIFCGFRYGFADYFQPYIWFNGETVRSVPFFIWFLGRAAVGSTGFVFLTTVAFGFSNLTKNTAVSIIIPYLAYSFSEIINLILAEFAPKLYTWSPFTYTSIWTLVYEKMPVLSETSFDLNTILIGLLTTEHNVAYGAVSLLAISSGIYLLSQLLFVRRDVK